MGRRWVPAGGLLVGIWARYADLVLSTGGCVVGDVVEVLLPEGLQAPARARSVVRDVGTQWQAEVLEVAVLLTSEVVTNAVCHGLPPVQLLVVVLPGLVRVEVRDGGWALSSSRARAAAVMPAAEAVGGRGLPLLDLLALRWGSRRTGGDRQASTRRGQMVWFELAHPGAAFEMV